MAEPTPDDVVVSARTLVRMVLEVRNLGKALNDLSKDLGARVTHLEEVVKTSGLNGHAPAIKKLAEMAPEIERRMFDPQMNQLSQMVEQGLPTIERLVELAPDIVAAIEQSKARQTFWRTLFALLFPRPVRYVLSLVLTAAITAAVFLVVNALWLHIPHVPA